MAPSVIRTVPNPQGKGYRPGPAAHIRTTLPFAQRRSPKRLPQNVARHPTRRHSRERPRHFRERPRLSRESGNLGALVSDAGKSGGPADFEVVSNSHLIKPEAVSPTAGVHAAAASGENFNRCLCATACRTGPPSERSRLLLRGTGTLSPHSLCLPGGRRQSRRPIRRPTGCSGPSCRPQWPWILPNARCWRRPGQGN